MPTFTRAALCTLLSLVLAIPMTAGAQAAQSGSDADWAKVIEAAKKEGTVVFYYAAQGSPLQPKIIKAFEAKYGIEVQGLNGRASEIRERIRTEQSSGRFLGDVTMNGHTTLSLMDEDQSFTAIGAIPNRANLVDKFARSATLTPVHVQTYGILVNTKLVKPADEPKSWKDLLDPKWKGKILSDDVRALGGGSVLFFTTEEAFGREYNEALARQAPVFSRDIANDEKRTARGEYPIYIPELTSYGIQLTGLPVHFVVPTEGVSYVLYDLAVLKNPPHPNAARLLINYFLDTESQLILANGGLVPVMKGVIEKTDPAVRRVVDVKLLGTTDPKRQNEMLDLAKSIYK